MTYRVFYRGQLVGEFASRDAALGFLSSGPNDGEYEILDDSDE
jgi:hypothetical protein